MWRFTLFGFPITVHWIFWVVGLIFGMDLMQIGGPLGIKLTLAWMIVFFVSILWHELGHAFAFRHYGQRANIVLYGMGGYAQGSMPVTRKQQIVVSLAGPAAGLLLGLVAWLAKKYVPGLSNSLVMVNFMHFLIGVNVFWSVMNLMPVLPLDGGRVCEAIVAGKRNAPTGLVPKIGLVTAIIVVIVAISLPEKYRQIYVAFLFGYLGYLNWQMLQNIHGRPSGGSPFGGGGGGPFSRPR